MWSHHLLAIFVFGLLASAVAVINKQTSQVLQQSASDSSSCHYNLFLANEETEGFGGASVTVLANGSPLPGLEAVTFPETLRSAGWVIPVVAGQVISLQYSTGVNYTNGNRLWVNDQNGLMVFAANNSESNTFTVGTVSCECVFAQDSSQCPEYRVRNEWRSLSFCEQQNFVNALLTIRTVPMADGSSLYDLYITHHNTYSTEIIGKSEFLPWHRAYLMRFENDVRSLGGNFTCFTIPYWDWSLDFSNESLSPIYAPFGGLRDESCLSAPFDSWYDPVVGTCVYRRHSGYANGIWAASTYPMFPPQSAVQLAATVNSSYVFIFKYLVRNPHKSVHNYVGGSLGSMSKLSSPADPLFWLHHANVDRIWALWQDCWDYDQPGQEYAQYEDLTAERDAGVDDNMVSVWPGVNTTAREILNLDRLKVSYPPMYEQWPRLHGRHEVFAPTLCKWDWFNPQTQAAMGINHLPQVYTDYQRERHFETVQTYRQALEGQEPEYLGALIKRMHKECDMGNAWDSEDFADMFNAQVDLNKKIGPSYLFRHACKLLGRNDLWQLFQY